MFNEFHEIGDLHDPDNLRRFLQAAIDNEEVDIRDAMATIGEAFAGQSRDITVEYKVALHALGHPEIARALESVRARIGDGMLGIGYGVDHEKGIDLTEATEEQREAMTNALIFVLRGHDFENVDRTEDGTRITFGVGCDDPEHNHNYEVDVATMSAKSGLRPDFRRTIDSFVHDMDETLGPSVPEPGEGRWGRWM